MKGILRYPCVSEAGIDRIDLVLQVGVFCLKGGNLSRMCCNSALEGCNLALEGSNLTLKSSNLANESGYLALESGNLALNY